MHLSTLSSWLDWIGSVHQKEIDLGLDRIREVAARLNLLKPAAVVITVGGTNGKGSVVAGLEAIYLAAGYRVGAFTSPILFVHNEEVRVNGTMADDVSFMNAFEMIESVRADVSLTPFEYHTLAALLIFAGSNLDVMLLEVGLGGRLDAVNIIDADAVVISSIGIDHVDWLGHTREAIAIEKAGIMRHGKPAVCGDDDPPETLIHAAREAGAEFYQRGRDFYVLAHADDWSWQTENIQYDHLPYNALLTENMASVLMVVSLLSQKLPVTTDALRRGLQTVTLPGRIQMVDGPVTEIFDVCHNPAAACVLAERLGTMPCTGNTIAVFSMLEDKDIAGTLVMMKEKIDHWHVAPLACKRGASLETLERHCEEAGGQRSNPASQEVKGSGSPQSQPDRASTSIHFHNSIPAAYNAACASAKPGDRIVIFGSFYTVAEIMRLKQS